MENIFKSSFQIYLFLIMKQAVLKCMLILAFKLICIFLIESETLNYMSTAYLKLKQREILRKDVDVFILFSISFGGVWFFSCCLFVFLTFMTARQLTTPSDLSSSNPLRCFFFFLSVTCAYFFLFQGKNPWSFLAVFFFLRSSMTFFLNTWPIATRGLCSYQLVKGFSILFNCFHYGGD